MSSSKRGRLLEPRILILIDNNYTMYHRTSTLTCRYNDSRQGASKNRYLDIKTQINMKTLTQEDIQSYKWRYKWVRVMCHVCQSLRTSCTISISIYEYDTTSWIIFSITQTSFYTKLSVLYFDRQQTSNQISKRLRSFDRRLKLPILH